MKFPGARLTPYLQSALRLAAAFIFIAHGVLFCFIWLFFSAAGPGPLSLDALRGRR